MGICKQSLHTLANPHLHACQLPNILSLDCPPPDNAIRAAVVSTVVANALLLEGSPTEKELTEVALVDAALEEPALAESIVVEVVKEAVPRDIRGCLVLCAFPFPFPFLGAPFLPADFGRFSTTRRHGSVCECWKQ